MNQPETLTAAAAARHIARGELAATELLEACLDQIRERDGEVAAWAHVDEAGARATARKCDDEARAGSLRGPLHGVPVGVKDVIDVAGMTTTAGAAAFAHTEPTGDATCVARLRAAGAVIVGKTTTTELAYFEPSPTRNPCNPAHTPGGSSSGSAAAVGARMVPVALGTQTIGSVLRPAAYCGVVGFKGTHGLVPGDGVVPLAALSLDHVGVLARSVEDVGLVFGLLADAPVEQIEPRAPRIAVARELLERAEADVAERVWAAAERLGDAGATVTEITLPQSFAAIHDAGQAVLAGEFATFQSALYRAHADEYRPRTRGLIEEGLAQHTHEYVRAQQARARFRAEIVPLLEDAGALLTPSAAGTAPAGLDFTGDPWFCAPWSSIGAPAISLPNGIGADSLPHAIQLVGPTGSDGELLGLAGWCERVLAREGGLVREGA